MDIKQLPVHEPIVKGYLHHAYQTAIIGSLQHARPWLYQNYIQLVSNVKGPLYPVQFYMPDGSGFNWSPLCPIFEHQRITRDFLTRNGVDVVEMMIDSIDDGSYAFTYVNEKYIPSTAAELRGQDYNHMIMIYGVDKSAKAFLIYGYDTSGHLSKRKVGFDQMAKAFWDNRYHFPRHENKITFMQVKEDIRFSFKLDYVVDQLIDFAESTCTVRNSMDYDLEYELIYGLDTYLFLNDSLRLMAEGEREVNIIPLHIIGEHKLMMAKRLTYMMEEMPGLPLEPFVERYVRLQNDFFAMRNYLLKLEFSGRLHPVADIIDQIGRIRTEEKEVLLELIATLQKKEGVLAMA